MKVKGYGDGKGRLFGYGFTCPGCGEHHHVQTERHDGPGGDVVWTFNGNLDSPTFIPSIKCWRDPVPKEEIADAMKDDWPDGYPGFCCHSVITDGKIFFCSDSTHVLKGTTVDLPDILAEGSA